MEHSPAIYKTGTNPLYQSWPVVIFQCIEGWAFGLVFDNPGYSTFKFSNNGKRMDYAVQDEELSYYILLGPTLPEVMRQLTSLTGKLMPLPKWALGYQQSRWSYAPSSRVREIAAEFRSRDIPCDVIYLDIDYMDRYKCFTWGKGFEDHEEMLRDLHSQGFKIVTILDPGLKIEPVVGPDIGGYKGMPTPELFERWILQGALYPYSRTHTSHGTVDQEPWSFGERVENSARKAIKLRYQLIPYLYSLLYEATQKGHPMMRPIFYHKPTTEALTPEFYETKFLLGPFLLTAPLMDLAPTRTCYLPPGKWYSWWCRNEHEGGQTYQTIAGEDTDLPLFVPENDVIPVFPDAPSFLPDHSFDFLEIIIAVTDKATGLVVEYFDRAALLAYEVHALKRKAQIEMEITLKSQGKIPMGYQPPGTLYIRLNHKIRNLKLSSYYSTYSIAPDPVADSWTRITINNPAFPLKGYFVL